MKCSCLPTDRNMITLQPTDKEDNQKFWEFRCTDVLEFYTIEWVARMLAAVILLWYYLSPSEDDTVETKSEQLTSLLLRILSVLLGTIILLLGRRFPKKFHIFLPIGYLIEFFMIVQESRLVKSSRNEDESLLGKD